MLTINNIAEFAKIAVKINLIKVEIRNEYAAPKIPKLGTRNKSSNTFIARQDIDIIEIVFVFLLYKIKLTTNK